MNEPERKQRQGGRVAATPIADPKTWLHIPSGGVWHERRWHRGRVVLALDGRVGHEIRVKPEDLGAPYWIRTASDRKKRPRDRRYVR